MKISRTGSDANHGTKSVNLPNPKFGWLKSVASLSIQHLRAKDFSSRSHHTYAMLVPIEEVNELLAALAKAALADPAAFEADLGPSMKSLAQLHAVAAGLVPAQ